MWIFDHLQIALNNSPKIVHFWFCVISVCCVLPSVIKSQMPISENYLLFGIDKYILS